MCTGSLKRHVSTLYVPASRRTSWASVLKRMDLNAILLRKIPGRREPPACRRRLAECAEITGLVGAPPYPWPHRSHQWRCSSFFRRSPFHHLSNRREEAAQRKMLFHGVRTLLTNAKRTGTQVDQMDRGSRRISDGRAGEEDSEEDLRSVGP